MRSFLKLCGIAYLGGIVAMWSVLIIAAFFDISFYNLFDYAAGIILVPVTPLGLPFFLGAMISVFKYHRGTNEAKKANK